jgi:hypothetical protein
MTYSGALTNRQFSDMFCLLEQPPHFVFCESTNNLPNFRPCCLESSVARIDKKSFANPLSQASRCSLQAEAFPISNRQASRCTSMPTSGRSSISMRNGFPKSSTSLGARGVLLSSRLRKYICFSRIQAAFLPRSLSISRLCHCSGITSSIPQSRRTRNLACFTGDE